MAINNSQIRNSVFVFFAIICMLLIGGCKQKEKKDLRSPFYEVTFEQTQPTCLKVEYHYLLKDFIDSHPSPGARYYIGMDQWNDSMRIFTMICQRKDTLEKRIPSLFTMNWRGKRIDIITGKEFALLPDSTSMYRLTDNQVIEKRGEYDKNYQYEFFRLDPKWSYYNPSDIFMDTSGFIIGYDCILDNNPEIPTGLRRYHEKKIRNFYLANASRYQHSSVLLIIRDFILQEISGKNKNEVIK